MPALEAVLSDMSRRKLDAMFCLGDLVGYGAFPNEVTAEIKASGIPTIMGNYDDGVGFDRDECGCAYRDPGEKERGHRSLMWTRQHTTGDNKAFLRSLASEIRRDAAGQRLLFVHGSPRRMNEYCSRIARFQAFNASQHRPMPTSSSSGIRIARTRSPIDGVRFVNAGSVGKPKDGDWRACYVILQPDLDDKAVEFVRLEYDIDRAIQAIRETDLPGEFADDLLQGLASPMDGRTTSTP